jgi:hypothetical protein
MKNCINATGRAALCLAVAGVVLTSGAIAAPCNYSNTVLATPGLTAYWRLNETVASGTATTWADESGNGHTGTQTIHAARVPTLNVPGPLPANGLLGFDATNTSARFNRNQSILSADSAGLDISTGNFTMEAWLKTSSLTGTLAVMGKHNASFLDGYMMMTNWWDTANHDAAARYRNSTGTEIGPATPGFADMGTADAWHHMVAVLHRNGGGPGYSGSGMSVYLDGSLAGTVASTALDGFNIDNIAEFAIGAANRDGSVGFVGDIDEVALYSRALTASEASAHYSAAFTPIPEPTSTALLVAIGVIGAKRSRRV